MMGLMLHCGSVEASEDEVRAVPVPERTQTWVPVSHGLLLDRVQGEIEGLGLRIVNKAFGLWNEGARMFGLLEVQNGCTHDDYGLLIGLRNSSDMTFPVGIAMGARVFVCDNLSFNSEIVLKTRHTLNVMDRLPLLVNRAMGMLINHRHQQDLRIDAYKNTPLNDVNAHDIMIRAIKSKVIAGSGITKVAAEWDTPSYPCFQERSVFSLFNAFTEALKGTNPADLPRRTMALHGLCDGFSGLAFQPLNN